MQGESKKARYDYIDNLKWVLTVVVIVHHCLGAAGREPLGNLLRVEDTYQWQYAVLGTFQGMNQSYFMALFFFLSALFVAGSYDRKGLRHFTGDRLKRLGIPIVFTYFVVNSLVAVIIQWGQEPPLESYLGYILGSFYFSGPVLNVDFLGVTWFCWALLVFNAAWLLLTSVRGATLPLVSRAPIPALWLMVLFAVAIIPVNYLALALMEQLGENFLGFHLLKYFPLYIAMFYFGILASRKQWLEQLEFKHAAAGIVMWVFGIACISTIAGGYGYNAEMPARGFTVVGMCLFLLVVFRECFPGRTVLTAALSRSAFAAYVVQFLFISLFAKLYEPFMTQIPLVNFVVLMIPSVTCSFAFGYLLTRAPGLRQVF
ncbi:MAG: acyltransferase [Halioglobus sp.]|nr:acyltransferase [Halioglobus sp.]